MSVAARIEPCEPEDGTEPVVVLAPMRVEARAVRAGAPWAQVQKIGMGPKRAARSAAAAGDAGGRAVLIAGFCGALDEGLEPGDVVLASELRDPSGEAMPCADPAILAGVLRRGGMRVHVGPVASSEKVVHGPRRRRLQRTGALAVDMESAWLAPVIRDRPLIALRVVLDTRLRELHRPLRTLVGAAVAYRALRQACGLAEEWTRALDPRDVVLASPRASCAGVDRAVEIVERVLEDRGAPVYVRKQIVHNAHVVHELEERGARFVDELDEVPEGATVVFSAHGVAPAVHREAASRTLDVVDATCPLVAKVHAEARRFAGRGDTVVLIGHAGHEEAEGTLGEAPERTVLVESVADVERLDVADPDRVAYLMQTTLSVEDSVEIVAALRRKFPRLGGPSSDDICYATSNRQRALADVASRSDVVLVVGSGNSSNSLRLVETAQRTGTTAYLVDGAEQVDPRWLDGVRTVGVSAGASAPSVLVEQVIDALAGLGPCTTDEHEFTTESVHFTLPKEVS